MIGREGLHRPVLIEMFEHAGATDVVSHLATGNVSFRVDDDRLDALLVGVEDALERLLGRPTPVFVRSLDALRRLLDAGMFDEPPFPDVRDRIVTFFRDAIPDVLELPVEHPGGDWVVFGRGPAELVSVTRARDDGRHPGAPGGAIERLAGEPVTSRALATLERIVTARS